MSVLLLGLCTAAAVYLYRQQATTAEILARNVVGRQLDYALETVVDELVTVQREGSDQVEALHERIQALLAQAQELTARRRNAGWCANWSTALRGTISAGKHAPRPSKLGDQPP